MDLLLRICRQVKEVENPGDWQDTCIASAMSEAMYDIGYLLQSEPAALAAIATKPRAVKPAKKPAIDGVAAMQAALAQELMRLAPEHDAFVARYLQLNPHSPGA